jgi:phage tail-like protein
VSVAEEMFARLPEAYQLRDIAGAAPGGHGVLRTIFEVVAPSLETVDAAIAALPQNLNPTTMPDAWLPWATSSIGWPVFPGLTVYTQREVLKRVAGWRVTRGTPGVYEEIIRVYTRSSAVTNGVTVTLTARNSIVGGFRIGRGRIGRGRIWHEFTNDFIVVRVTALNGNAWDAKLEALVRGVLEALLPARMDFKLIPPV